MDGRQASCKRAHQQGGVPPDFLGDPCVSEAIMDALENMGAPCVRGSTDTLSHLEHELHIAPSPPPPPPSPRARASAMGAHVLGFLVLNGRLEHLWALDPRSSDQLVISLMGSSLGMDPILGSGGGWAVAFSVCLLQIWL